MSNERQRRFKDLYNADMDELHCESTTARMLAVIDDMVTARMPPKVAAEQIASLIEREAMPENSFIEVLAISQHAAVRLENEHDMQKFVDFFSALASLPDAVNNTTEPQKATTYHPAVESGTLIFQPGEAIVLENGRLWRDLPGFSMDITEDHQGPEQYLVKHRGKDDPATATRKWEKLNTYLALFAASESARATPVLANMSWLGLKTLAISLEQSCDAWNFHADLWMPAAFQWMRIAGEEIARVCAEGTTNYPAGDVWKAKGGSDVCDTQRLEFWKSRLEEKRAERSPQP